MAEIDLFERSLAGAFLRLVDDVLGAVDAADVAHRVALEHPRRRTTVLRWRVAVPRPAWILLLVAALLAALVGGMMIVGSQPERKLPAVVPPVGQVFQCPPGSNPDKPGLPAIAYDEAAERTVILGQGHSSAYDAAADRWETLYVTPYLDQPGACGTRPECRYAHQMVYDPVNERLAVYGGVARTADNQDWVSTDDVLAFDTRTREWTVLLEPSGGQAAPP